MADSLLWARLKKAAVRFVFYGGFRYYCPVCKSKFRKLMPFGGIPRKNARCPKCFSLERHRLLWLYLKEKTVFFDKRLKVLHFAPEICFKERFRNLKNLDYVSADLTSPLAQKKIDITQIPEPDETFDVILCSHVLEHVPDDLKAMRELWRVLKKGGWAILQVPITLTEVTVEDSRITHPKDRLLLFGQSDHVRRYGPDYKDRLEEAGFTVKKDSFSRSLPSRVIEKYCLHHEHIYFCTKE